MRPFSVAFVGSISGAWTVERMEAIRGPALAPASHVEVVDGFPADAPVRDVSWVLRGVTSNERYVTRVERDALAARQEPLGRPGSTRAALIPITKSERWWELAQDERRSIFEERSHHVAVGLEYVPGIARRLH